MEHMSVKGYMSPGARGDVHATLRSIESDGGTTHREGLVVIHRKVVVMTSSPRSGVFAAVGVSCCVVALVGATLGPSAGVLAGNHPPAYSVVNVGAYGGEPSIISDTVGRLYESTPSGGTITYGSSDGGQSWAK